MYYHSDLSSKSITLGREESNHCVKVLRKKNGDTITLMDGKGSIATGIISNASPKGCTIAIATLEKHPLPSPTVHLILAPTKNLDRMEWLCEKAAELGVTEISFVLCQNSERRVLKTERLNKKVISAIKQSGNPFAPTLNELEPFGTTIAQMPNTPGARYICYVDPNNPTMLKDSEAKDPYTLLIGPEGDFTTEEVELALQAGFKKVSLGNNVLRTETAALKGIVTLLNK